MAVLAMAAASDIRNLAIKCFAFALNRGSTGFIWVIFIIIIVVIVIVFILLNWEIQIHFSSPLFPASFEAKPIIFIKAVLLIPDQEDCHYLFLASIFSHVKESQRHFFLILAILSYW